MTTTSITAVSVSMRKAQSTRRSAEASQVATWTRVVPCPKPTWTKATQDSAAEISSSVVVTISEARAPISRPKRPAIRKPIRGRKTIA